MKLHDDLLFEWIGPVSRTNRFLGGYFLYCLSQPPVVILCSVYNTVYKVELTIKKCLIHCFFLYAQCIEGLTSHMRQNSTALRAEGCERKQPRVISWSLNPHSWQNRPSNVTSDTTNSHILNACTTRSLPPQHTSAPILNQSLE